jgi:tRNA pseudouridine55 synthase
MMNGLLNFNKPRGMVSREVVDRVGRHFRRTPIGHTGTLDPLATGVLVLCLGQATRLVEHVQRMRKTYFTRIRLGATSASDDTEAAIEIKDQVLPLERTALERRLTEFVGEIEQVPPRHSAAKVGGVRAYNKVRRGENVELQPRRVVIHGIQLLRYEYPEVDLVVECGKGTYIRSLARDLGQQLGCGGLVQELERRRIGPFGIETALSIDAPRETLEASLMPPRLALAESVVVTLEEHDLMELHFGRGVGRADSWQDGQEIAILTEWGEVAAECYWRASSRQLRPRRVFWKPEKRE